MRFMGSATSALRAADGTAGTPVHAEQLQAVWERTGSRPGGLTVDEVASRRGPASTEAERSQVGAILEEVAESADVAAVVHTLEQQYDAYVGSRDRDNLLAGRGGFPTADELGAELERFLADQPRRDDPEPGAP